MTRTTLACLSIVGMASALALAGCGSSSEAGSATTGTAPASTAATSTSANGTSTTRKAAGAISGAATTCELDSDFGESCQAMIKWEEFGFKGPDGRYSVDVRLPDDSGTWKLTDSVTDPDRCPTLRGPCSFTVNPGTYSTFDGADWYTYTVDIKNLQNLASAGYMRFEFRNQGG